MSGDGNTVLRCDAVAKRFGATSALEGVDLALGAGEIFAVHGASGSGKSTLLFCLAGILVPDSGHVTYGTTDLGSLNDKQRTLLRRREFGFVFQFAQLVPELTAIENVEVPLLLNGMGREEARRTAGEWLDHVGVADQAELVTGELSGGQAQLVAVARALVHAPKVVFADEPTGALHSAAGDRVMQLMVNVAQHAGTSIVLVTHDARVAAYAGREVQLRDGRVEEATVAR